jgi:hypothetical protein
MDAGSTAFGPCSAYLQYSSASSRASASRFGKSADSCIPHIASPRERIGGLLLATECLFPDAQLSCTASHDLALGSIHQRPTFLSLSAFAITDRELRLIAALAIIGLSSRPNSG